MVDLFGTDIRGIVADAINSAGGVVPMTLNKISTPTIDSGNVTGDDNPTPTPIACQGFLENANVRRINGTLVPIEGELLTIIGGTLPDGTAPESGDTATILGRTYEIVGIVEVDPAEATYEMEVLR